MINYCDKLLFLKIVMDLAMPGVLTELTTVAISDFLTYHATPITLGGTARRWSNTMRCRDHCVRQVKLLLIYIWNFHFLSHLLLIYICKLHWNLICVRQMVRCQPYRFPIRFAGRSVERNYDQWNPAVRCWQLPPASSVYVEHRFLRVPDVDDPSLAVYCKKILFYPKTVTT